MPKRGKKYQGARQRFDRQTSYAPGEAVELVKTLSFAGFDETVEASFRLGIDPRQADQAVRGTVGLPHGTGKSVRVAVFAEGEQAREAERAGADLVGGKELIEEIAGGRSLDFDVAIAVPSLMAEVGKLGRVLGPRGLMPNPKTGTVTPDVAKAVGEYKAGRIEYRNDRYGNVAVPIGKVSFSSQMIIENLAAVTLEITRARPAAAKGRYVRNLSLSSTMGPGVTVDASSLEDLAKLAR
ncbi:MAG TPA: 50S ribosomal protein L1 [Acidimicrobiia bacterium]